MADFDVWLSYSSKDRQLAQRLAERLEASGLKVGWDVGIRAGADWDREIQSGLRSATRIVALVTEDYARSRIAHYELAAGREQGKLVPVVFGKAELPFPLIDVQYIDGNKSDWEDKLLETLLNKAAKPSAPKKGFFGALALQELRIQSLYWFGVGCAVVTLAGNLDAILIFAGWIEWINVNWAQALTWFWNFIVPFDFRILSEDAVVFTLLATLFLNLLLTSSDASRNVSAGVAAYVLLVIAVAVTGYVAFMGFVYEAHAGQVGLTDQIMQPVIGTIRSFTPSQLDNAVAFLGMTIAGSVALLIAYLPAAAGFRVRPNVRAFGARLWRILFGVALVAVANQVTLSIERHDWNALTEIAEQ